MQCNNILITQFFSAHIDPIFIITLMKTEKVPILTEYKIAFLFCFF